MKTAMKARFVVLLFLPLFNCERGDNVGCANLPPASWVTHSGGSVDVCLQSCEDLYYKYALLSKGAVCHCRSMPGDVISSPLRCNAPCLRNFTQMCGGDDAASVYDTGFNRPGPPRGLSVSNVTDTRMHIRWDEPQAHGDITAYKVGAKPIHTYSSMALNPLEWYFSNDTYRTDLPNLIPCTIYNITIQAIGAKEPGVIVSERVETNIADPEPAPQPPTILERHKEHFVVSIPEAFNYNGPVTKYRIVVINDNLKSPLLPEYLKSYDEAQEDGLPYYITAELDPGDITTKFIVGDERVYNGFRNVRLSTPFVRLLGGIVSTRNGISKYRYTDTLPLTAISPPSQPDSESTSGWIVALAVGITLIIVVIVVAVVFLYVLRRRSNHMRRHRLSQSMPLSEPCAEVENEGFLAEGGRGNLARHSWNIPRNFLEVENSNIVGIGNFGQFVRGNVQQHGTQVPTLVQAIADQTFEPDRKKSMLVDLDMLIRTNGHDNVVALIGICELPDTLYIVLEDSANTLKDFLVSSRQLDLQNNKFSMVNESRIMQICLGVTRGMEFLAAKGILHKKLCARNIWMADNTVPKIGGFGLSYMHPVDRKPDYTRWTAQELFKQTRFYTQSDVWSYGCLLWEIFSLGATLYPNVATKDVPMRVLRGLRPAQLSYVGDEVYQTCLHCWQIDLDERPTFHQLSQTMEKLSLNIVAGMISFTYYQNFQYEPYNPQMETEH